MLTKIQITPSVAILFSGLLIAGAILFTHYYPASQALGEVAPPSSEANVPAPSASDHIIGSPSADIVLIEYSDFQCVYCARAHATFKRLVEESGGGVAWVMRNLPLDSIHPEATPSALAAECIAELGGNDAYWGFADTIFGDQSSMNAARYLQIAQSLGVGGSEFEQCVASRKYSAKVQQEYKEALASGATGTPFTVIYAKGKQYPISGALPYEQFKALIEAVQ